VQYAPDLAWLVFYEDKIFDEPLSNEDLSGSDYAVESVTSLSNIQKVLISLRSDRLKEQELEAIVNGLNYLYPEATYSLAALQESDLRVLQKISGSIKSSEIIKLYELEDPLDKFELNQIFTDVDLALCMRFHAVLVAAALCVPTAALAYDPKVEELGKQLSLPYLKLNELSSDKNFIQFVQELESKIPSKKNLTESVAKMADLTKKINSQVIRNLVDELGE
ncbi:MAG: hypothetical protein SFU25_10465, partial [Candidatus Caenarcaniphilales bacterium]|nr:hypothetical protein [Candidatus Caenarcaniphilales bacterium]